MLSTVLSKWNKNFIWKIMRGKQITFLHFPVIYTPPLLAPHKINILQKKYISNFLRYLVTVYKLWPFYTGVKIEKNNGNFLTWVLNHENKFIFGGTMFEVILQLQRLKWSFFSVLKAHCVHILAHHIASGWKCNQIFNHLTARAERVKRVLYLREVRGCHNNKAAFLSKGILLEIFLI